MVDRLDPRLRHAVEPTDGTAGTERPAALAGHIREDPDPLMEWANRPVLSARQFERPALKQLFRLAAQFESVPALDQSPLQGKILITAFYEPSTRTRLSFESAWHRLGGDIMSITDPSSTAMAKGESLHDVAEMFNNYGDVLVLRDSNADAAYEMLERLRIPIINAGNGVDEHPTQALADVYTIAKWRPGFLDDAVPENERIRIGIIGVPSRMRTVRSLLILLARCTQAIHEVVVICHDAEPLSSDQFKEFQEANLEVRVARRLDQELPRLDVVYINSIAWVGDSYEELTGDIGLSATSPLKPGAIILHPLARGEELATDLDDTPHNWYFAQARGAVYVRMALLITLVQRISRVMDAQT